MNFKVLFLLVVHLVVLVVIYLIFSHFNLFLKIPTNENLLQFDAQLYKQLGSEGYRYIPEKPCNLAFFPLFPYLWDLSSLTPLAVSTVNLILFSVSMCVLVHPLSNIDFRVIFSILALPSVVFFAVPYSESLFFCFSCAILISYKIDSPWLKYVGFIGASLTRSVSVIFIPAIVICEIFNNPTQPLPARILNAIKLIITNIAALLIVAYVQFYQTGKWFYFIEVQEFWHRKLSKIVLPITTMSENRLMAVDSIALVIGVIALIYLSRTLWSKISARKDFNQQHVNNSVLFSIFYLACITVIDVLFTSSSSGTNIWSLNRHLIATPFFITFSIWIVKKAQESQLESLIMITATVIIPFLTFLYKYPFTLVLQYVFTVLLFTSAVLKLNAKGFFVVYLFCSAIQLYFFYGFISGQFLG